MIMKTALCGHRRFKMKKFISLIIVGIYFVAGLSHAEPKYRGTSEALYPPGTSVTQVFDGYSTLGVGIPISPDFLADQGSWQIVVNGSPSAYEIAVEGSLVSNIGPYVPISVIDETTVNLRHWDGKAVPFSQVIINSTTGSASFDLYLIKRGN